MGRKKCQKTREELINAYNECGTFEAAATRLGISRKTFSKLWYNLVKVRPQLMGRKIPTAIDGDVPVLELPSCSRIGLVSDTHLVSRYQQITALYDFYQYCESEGITTILHAGDLADGVGLYEGHPFDTFLHTKEQMIKYVIDYYPRYSGKTYYITGNHDSSIPELVDKLNQERDDMVFVGNGSAIIKINNRKIFLHHGKKGSEKYAKSDKPPQMAVSEIKHIKIIPDIVVLGHYHTIQILPDYGGLYVIQMPCFQGQLRWNLLPSIGGVILELDNLSSPYRKYHHIVDDF